MAENNRVFVDEPSGRAQQDLREQVATTLLERLSAVAGDTRGMFPLSGEESPAPEYYAHMGQLLVQLLALAVRDGKMDPRGSFISDLHRVVLERDLAVGRLFG